MPNLKIQMRHFGWFSNTVYFPTCFQFSENSLIFHAHVHYLVASRLLVPARLLDHLDFLVYNALLGSCQSSFTFFSTWYFSFFIQVELESHHNLNRVQVHWRKIIKILINSKMRKWHLTMSFFKFSYFLKL